MEEVENSAVAGKAAGLIVEIVVVTEDPAVSSEETMGHHREVEAPDVSITE